MYAFLSLLKGHPEVNSCDAIYFSKINETLIHPNYTPYLLPIQHFKQEDRNLAMFQMDPRVFPQGPHVPFPTRPRQPPKLTFLLLLLHHLPSP